jgi:hypothetical protein
MPTRLGAGWPPTHRHTCTSAVLQGWVTSCKKQRCYAAAAARHLECQPLPTVSNLSHIPPAMPNEETASSTSHQQCHTKNYATGVSKDVPKLLSPVKGRPHKRQVF